MARGDIVIGYRKINDQTAAIDIRGELTSFAESDLLDALTGVSHADLRYIILNFTDMSYMNSSGIGLLVMLLVRANRLGYQLMAVGLKDHFRNVFELTRLNQALPIYADESEALNTISSGISI